MIFDKVVPLTFTDDLSDTVSKDSLLSSVINMSLTTYADNTYVIELSLKTLSYDLFCLDL